MRERRWKKSGKDEESGNGRWRKNESWGLSIY
jgi:hypothetical protein